MQMVASRGPKDPGVWRKLVSRADVIAHSLTSRQAALILSALARVQYKDESFLRRFNTRFVPGLVQHGELIDLVGIVSGLSLLGVYDKETFALIAKRLSESAADVDARQLSLIANAFARVGHVDHALFEELSEQVPRLLGDFEARDAALLLNALAQLLSGSQEVQCEAVAGAGLGITDSDARTTLPQFPGLEKHLNAIALRLPELLPSADLHSLTLLLNAFAQFNFVQKDALDLMTEEFLAGKRMERLSPRQLAMTLNAAAKLQLYERQLLDALSARAQQRARELDAHALCLVANASAKLRLGLDMFTALHSCVPRLLPRFSGRQLAMLCHAWARAHVHCDDLFELFALPLVQKSEQLTSHEVGLTVYGYAHFRKAPPELFGPLVERFAALLEAGAATELDVLMVGNGLRRVGWRDDRISEAMVNATSGSASFGTSETWPG